MKRLTVQPASLAARISASVLSRNSARLVLKTCFWKSSPIWCQTMTCRTPRSSARSTRPGCHVTQRSMSKLRAMKARITSLHPGTVRKISVRFIPKSERDSAILILSAVVKDRSADSSPSRIVRSCSFTGRGCTAISGAKLWRLVTQRGLFQGWFCAPFDASVMFRLPSGGIPLSADTTLLHGASPVQASGDGFPIRVRVSPPLERYRRSIANYGDTRLPIPGETAKRKPDTKGGPNERPSA